MFIYQMTHKASTGWAAGVNFSMCAWIVGLFNVIYVNSYNVSITHKSFIIFSLDVLKRNLRNLDFPRAVAAFRDPQNKNDIKI